MNWLYALAALCSASIIAGAIFSAVATRSARRTQAILNNRSHGERF